MKCAESIDLLINKSCNKYSEESKNQIYGIYGSRETKAEEETKDLESYCGNRPTEKKGTKMSNLKASKSAFTGMCTIDSIVNLFRSINYIQTIRGHNICDHKAQCSTCILRSAICKAELGQGVNKFVLIPEFKHNLNMFMGSYFCSECMDRFEKEDEMCHLEKDNCVGLDRYGSSRY